MKKSSIIISLTLVLTMITSCFTGWPICSVSAAENETKVYFEVPTLESWGTTKSVYCHIYNVYGGTKLKNTSFQSKEELCKKDVETGLYYFDTAKLGTIEEGADYALVFSTLDTVKGLHLTCSITFGKDCLGDIVYVTGEMIENAEDSSKSDFEGAWKNNSDKFGAMAVINSTGKIVGKYFPIFQPREQIVAQFLASWAVLNANVITREKVEDICAELKVNPADVLEQYKTDYAEQLADPENNPLIAPVETVAKLLDVDTYPITSTFVVAGVSELCGKFWKGDPEIAPENIMVAQADGTYKKVYTNVAVMNNYQFKIVNNFADGSQNWIGIGIDNNDNFTFSVVSVCDVTITFDPETSKITVTGDGVEIPTELNVESMRTVGNGDGNWLNGVAWDPAADENLMTEVSPKVYEITYTDLDAFENYQVKFAANGSWAANWGGIYGGSGIESEATFNSYDNITIEVPYELADVTLRLDLSNYDHTTKTGATFTVTVVEHHDHVFTDTWEKDDTYHWHKCQHENCTEIKDQAKHSGGTATCTSKAVCEYCDEEYGELDLDNHSLKHTAAKEATASETGNIEYWLCIDCEKYFLDEEGTKEIQFEDTIISKKAPEVIKGKGQSVNQGEKKELSFTSNASYDDFKYVKLDGNELDPKNYTVKEGSTIVTLNKDFVSTLKAGKHTIVIVSETGEASTEFTVNKKTSVIKPSSDKNTTNTGLISNIGLWISLMFTSLDAMIIGFVLNKKRRS
ncbi:hemoblobin-interacting domain-containing protein [Floccifex porci]|uniref:Heme-binding protein Shr-like Hb-interacting domain-containing protein n=1 Tax=Floccifex porci TaxID=2606629 RepID=A0A7X2N309_9FIRM|nr:hypothetical protein [Floccifex porci]MSS01492.1 hypothetical protein [Floccifex porci]